MAIDHVAHLTASSEGPKRNRSFCRSIVRFLCSNIGLLIIAIAYCVAGAFLFTLLEQYIELQNCQKGNLLENVSISNISESIFNYVAITDDNETKIYAEIESYLSNFTDDIYDRRSEYRYSGQECATSSAWEFPSALLFTISVVASIGFGHVTPTTWEGQITCICYALIGIPIFLLCLTNISSILGDIFRFLYSALLRVLCCFCRIYTRNRNSKKREKNRDISGPNSSDSTWPEADDDDDETKGEVFTDAPENDEYENEDEEEFNDVWTRMETRVPTGLVLVIIIGYLCLGAIMFNRFEGWTMTESVYFCFITLSTIGFGDFVPGITSGSTSGLRFLAASLYIIIGLAILAMSFDLLKESLVEKFLWIGQKTGLITEDDDQVDEDLTRYVNFEYSQPTSQTPIPVRFDSRPISEAPPSYDNLSPRTNVQWFDDIPDKDVSTTRRYGY